MTNFLLAFLPCLAITIACTQNTKTFDSVDLQPDNDYDSPDDRDFALDYTILSQKELSEGNNYWIVPPNDTFKFNLTLSKKLIGGIGIFYLANEESIEDYTRLKDLFNTNQIDSELCSIICEDQYVKAMGLRDEELKAIEQLCNTFQISDSLSNFTFQIYLKNNVISSEEELNIVFKNYLPNSLFVFINDESNDKRHYIPLMNLLPDVIEPYFIPNVEHYGIGEGRDIEGIVTISTKNFAGNEYFNVPFIGEASGDIDRIFINNKEVKFELGVEFYLKQQLKLDYGYNRIPIRIIDKRENVTNSFYEIEIEDF